MSDDAEELRDLVRSARAWVEWIGDSGVVELASETDLSREIAALSRGGIGGAGGARGREPAPASRAFPSPRGGDPRAPQSTPAAPPSRSASAGPVAATGGRSAGSIEPPRGTAVGDEPGPAAGLSPAERRRRLALLADEANACTRCRLHEGRTRSVFSRGTPDAEIVFVGEGPGYHEDQQGKPFVGAAGQLLDKMIAAMGLSPDEVYICNAVKCRPPDNRKPEPDEMAACAPYLQQQLEIIQPKVIVALGATGVQALIGSSAGITRIRGTWKLYRGRIPIMPTFHPAYLLRSPDKKREVWDDLKQVLARLGRTPPKRRRP